RWGRTLTVRSDRSVACRTVGRDRVPPRFDGARTPGLLFRSVGGEVPGEHAGRHVAPGAHVVSFSGAFGLDLGAAPTEPGGDGFEVFRDVLLEGAGAHPGAAVG